MPLDPETGEAVLGPIEDRARRTLDNLRQVLELAGSFLDKVVRVDVFLSDENDFEKARGKWAYLYRALDKLGNAIDFYLFATPTTASSSS